jgi:hypothetical protein
VIVYVAVQMTWLPGATGAEAGQSITGAGPVPVNSVSLTAMSVSVVLPVLVITKRYPTSWPTTKASGSAGVALLINFRLGS